QVYFDDQIILTQDISGSGSYPVSCTTACTGSTGSHTFKATVTDAGLYQASDEQTVNVTNTGGGTGFNGLTPADGSQQPSGPVTFSWTADPGANLYTLFVDGVLRGTIVGTSKTVSGLANGTHTWYVHTDTGDTTD